MMLEESRKRIRIEPRDRRYAAGSRFDDDFRPLDLARAASSAPTTTLFAFLNRGLTEDQFDIGGSLERLLNVMAEALDYPALALYTRRMSTVTGRCLRRRLLRAARDGRHGRSRPWSSGAADLMQVPPTCSRSITTTSSLRGRARSQEVCRIGRSR